MTNRTRRIWYVLATPLRLWVTVIFLVIFWTEYELRKRGHLRFHGHRLPERIRELIRQAKRIEVLALEGLLDAEEPSVFAGCRVVGQVAVEDARTRSFLARRLVIANEASGQNLKCIDAEYGLRITADDVTINIMICFACGNMWITGPPEYSGFGTVCWWPVGGLLNRILHRAGIPIPQPGLHH